MHLLFRQINYFFTKQQAAEVENQWPDLIPWTEDHHWGPFDLQVGFVVVVLSDLGQLLDGGHRYRLFDPGKVVELGGSLGRFPFLLLLLRCDKKEVV